MERSLENKTEHSPNNGKDHYSWRNKYTPHEKMMVQRTDLKLFLEFARNSNPKNVPREVAELLVQANELNKMQQSVINAMKEMDSQSPLRSLLAEAYIRQQKEMSNKLQTALNEWKQGDMCEEMKAALEKSERPSAKWSLQPYRPRKHLFDYGNHDVFCEKLEESHNIPVRKLQNAILLAIAFCAGDSIASKIRSDLDLHREEAQRKKQSAEKARQEKKVEKPSIAEANEQNNEHPEKCKGADEQQAYFLNQLQKARDDYEQDSLVQQCKAKLADDKNAAINKAIQQSDDMRNILEETFRTMVMARKLWQNKDCRSYLLSRKGDIRNMNAHLYIPAERKIDVLDIPAHLDNFPKRFDFLFRPITVRSESNSDGSLKLIYKPKSHIHSSMLKEELAALQTVNQAINSIFAFFEKEAQAPQSNLAAHNQRQEIAQPNPLHP